MGAAGLDSTNALHLVRVLRRLCASSHMTALASLHQCRAEVMGELDLLLLMTRGRAVFCGPATHALRFVQSHFRTIKARENPMEFVVDFLTNIPALAADQVPAMLSDCLFGYLVVAPYANELNLGRRADFKAVSDSSRL